MTKKRFTLLVCVLFALCLFLGTVLLYYSRQHLQSVTGTQQQNKTASPEALNHTENSAKNPFSHLGVPFTLTSASGKVRLSDFSGKLVILYFGFTSCPDICPASLARIAHGLKQLETEQREQIQTMMISVDPERDTATKLAEYVQFFAADFIGLTGEAQDIKRILTAYGSYARKVTLPESAMGYTMDHGSKIYLLDRQGKVIKMFDHNILPDKLAAEISLLL